MNDSLFVGIDLGSVRAGLAILDIVDDEISYHSSYQIAVKGHEFYEKMHFLCNAIEEILEEPSKKNNIHLCIEAPFIMYINSARVLYRLFGAVERTCGLIKNTQVITMPPLKIRKTIGVKGKEGSIKERTLIQSKTLVAGIPKDKEFKEDEGDALGIALACYLYNND